MPRGRKPLADALKRSVRDLRSQGIGLREICQRLLLNIHTVKAVIREYRNSYRRQKPKISVIALPEPVICRSCRKLIDVLPCQSCKIMGGE